MKPRLFSEMNKVFIGMLILSMINSALAKRKETAGTQWFQLNHNWSFKEICNIFVIYSINNENVFIFQR